MSDTQSASSHQNNTPPQASQTSTEHCNNGAYQAPYYRNECPIPGCYIVSFHPGHTIAKHFAFLGREFNPTALKQGYFADIDDELFDAVRSDPGLEFIEDNTSGESD